MPDIPKIQIRQTYAKIGMDSERARITIEQPKAEMTIEQENAKFEMESTPPQLEIDYTKAWRALGKRPPVELSQVIADESRRLAMEGIADRVEKGNRLAAIHIKQDPIPEFAAHKPDLGLNLLGDASIDNVDITFIPGKLNVNWRDGYANTDVTTHTPKVGYIPGDLNIYIRQKNSIEIIPPKIYHKL